MALEKERAAAEGRGHSAAALQAQGERAALQEQLTFLKMQLQYALKASMRACALMRRARRSSAVGLRCIRGCGLHMPIRACIGH